MQKKKNKTKKKLKNFFCFSDNCISIVCVKLSLVSRYRFSSTVKVLTKHLRILCITKRETFSNGTTFTVINIYCKGALIQIPEVFRPICLVVCLRVF